MKINKKNRKNKIIKWLKENILLIWLKENILLKLIKMYYDSLCKVYDVFIDKRKAIKNLLQKTIYKIYIIQPSRIPDIL